MEKLFMSAGVVVAIILCLIGIIKLPFGNFKTKYPKAYKAIFTVISFVFVVGLCLLDELYILNGKILSIDFVVLLCASFAGVFFGYGGIYEGLGLKQLVKKLVENIKKARNLATSKKVVKYLDKIEDLDKAILFLEEKRNQRNNEV